MKIASLALLLAFQTLSLSAARPQAGANLIGRQPAGGDLAAQLSDEVGARVEQTPGLIGRRQLLTAGTRRGPDEQDEGDEASERRHRRGRQHETPQN